MRAQRVAGVDGCRGGWVVAVVDSAGGELPTIQIVTQLRDLMARVRSGELAAVGIDMPIGLAATGRRAADTAARARLGPRRSSLFPTPPADVLGATEYADALARCRAASGVGMSKQAFNLLPKMREVAAVVTPDLQPAVSEVHPETTFAALGRAPCTHPKRTAAGVAERLGLLRAHFPSVDQLVAHSRKGVGTDDVLDALAAAWTARRIALGTAEWLGDTDARDSRGLRLTIAV